MSKKALIKLNAWSLEAQIKNAWSAESPKRTCMGPAQNVYVKGQEVHKFMCVKNILRLDPRHLN